MSIEITDEMAIKVLNEYFGITPDGGWKAQGHGSALRAMRAALETLNEHEHEWREIPWDQRGHDHYAFRCRKCGATGHIVADGES